MQDVRLRPREQSDPFGSFVLPNPITRRSRVAAITADDIRLEERISIDDLAEQLTTIGDQIARDGCDGNPAVLALASAAQPFAPIAAAILASSDEPDIIRSRAFLKIAIAVQQLSDAEKKAIAHALVRAATTVLTANEVTSEAA